MAALLWTGRDDNPADDAVTKCPVLCPQDANETHAGNEWTFVWIFMELGWSGGWTDSNSKWLPSEWVLGYSCDQVDCLLYV